MLIVALWFLLPTPLTQLAINNYKRQNYPAARAWLTPLTWTSPDPFVISFNAGTVDTQLAKYNLAQTELVKALALAPIDRRCMVLQNLVISLNDHAASLESNLSLSQDASTYTDDATTIKENNPVCFRVVAKAKSSGGGGGGGGGSSSLPTQILTSAQSQQLQQKNSQGDQLEQPQYQQNSVNPNSPSLEPW